MELNKSILKQIIFEVLSEEEKLEEAEICAAGKNYVDGKTIGGQKVSRGKDGKFNNWSARAAQIASKYCKDPNYGRGGKKKNEAALPEGDLGDWEEENWTHSDGTPCGGGDKDGSQSRCKPAKKWPKMSKGEIAADNAKKREGTKAGKQYVPATKKGKVTKAYTKESVDRDLLKKIILEVLAEETKDKYGPEVQDENEESLKKGVADLKKGVADLDEVYSDKQRRWACAQTGKSRKNFSGKPPLSKAEADEMCSGPMKK